MKRKPLAEIVAAALKVDADKLPQDIKDAIASYSTYTGTYAVLKDREIFATGTHNGDVFNTEHLDGIVSAFKSLDFVPALKAGHDDTPGAPALGYLDNVRRTGDKLIADFVDVPEPVAAAIKDRRFDRVSAEMFFNFNRAGKSYPRALKALALLGAEVPAVAGLQPLSASFASDADVRYYDRALDKEHQEIDMDKTELAKAIADALAANNVEVEKRFTTLKAEHATQIDALTKRYDSKVEVLTSGQRDAKVDALVEKCSIPALRPFVRTFAVLAFDQPAEKKYALGVAGSDGKTPEGTALDGVTKLIETINGAAKRNLFTVVSVKPAATGKTDAEVLEIDEGTTQQQIKDEVEKRIAAYAVEKKIDLGNAKSPDPKKYREAMTGMFAMPENAPLRSAYENIREYKQK